MAKKREKGENHIDDDEHDGQAPHQIRRSSCKMARLEVTQHLVEVQQREAEIVVEPAPVGTLAGDEPGCDEDPTG